MTTLFLYSPACEARFLSLFIATLHFSASTFLCITITHHPSFPIFFLLPLTPTLPPPTQPPHPLTCMLICFSFQCILSSIPVCSFLDLLRLSVVPFPNCCPSSFFLIFILFLNSLLVLLFFYTSSSKPTCTRSIEKDKNKKVGRQSGRVGQLLLAL